MHAVTGIILLLSYLSVGTSEKMARSEGGIIRGATGEKQLALVFTGGHYAEGGAAILDALKERGIKAAFFFTGDFLRMPEHEALVKRLVREGHYLGPHSDKHLLYCPWEGEKKTLVSKEDFRRDLEANLEELARFGVKREAARYWIPPFEWYNEEISSWSEELGLKLINFTPGTRSNADYTGEKDKNFVSSQEIIDSILAREEADEYGLNGFLLLLHVGAGPGRVDKMHVRLAELLDVLARRGYSFKRVDGLLAEE